jgi:hypothetical protein
MFVGPFAKFRKATINFIMSVRLPIRMEQVGFDWTDFGDAWYLIIFRKSVKKIQFSIK